MSKNLVKSFKTLFLFWGKVRKGKNRGKNLGFPTANMNLSKNIPEGIYVSLTKVNGSVYPSVTFVGRSITFNEYWYHAECFLFSFNKNIYNRWISVRLLKKIRNNKKFNSQSKLVTEMKKDVVCAKMYFRNFQVD